MRFYIYVSDGKLDQMAGQVRRKFREKFVAQLKVCMKVFSVSLTERPSERSRYDKVELVRQKLIEEGKLGTLEGDEVWFSGALSMHWGPYLGSGMYGWGPRDDQADLGSAMVFFAGSTPNVRIGLGGSRAHVLAEQSSLPDAAQHIQVTVPGLNSPSELNYIMMTIRRVMQAEDKDGMPGGPERAGEIVAATVDRILDEARALDLPPTPVEFIARRLYDVTDPTSGQRVILATPLYVALAEAVAS